MLNRNSSLVGLRFGRLVVLRVSHINDKNQPVWVCKCDCGDQKLINYRNLLFLGTKSCGCLQKDAVRKSGTTHGFSSSKNGKQNRLYRTWRNVKSRCNTPSSSKYHLYGGKGITIHPEWEKDFMSFYNWAIENGYEDHLTIDRIDSNGNYEPSNCRWATYSEQARNTTQNHYLEYRGERKTIVEWSEILGMKYSTLSCRIKYYGWSVEKALTTPVEKRNYKPRQK